VEDYAGCQCIRADQISRSTQITTDISDYIQRSRFLIADLTDSNPNVFYEVGLFPRLRKGCDTAAPRGFKAPFDIQGIRYIRYSKSTLPDLAASLKGYVKGCLRTLPIDWPKNVRSDIQVQLGKKGEKWKAGQMVLRYSIAEMFAYGTAGHIRWKENVSHSISVEFIAPLDYSSFTCRRVP
jgi:hypothetical protein